MSLNKCMYTLLWHKRLGHPSDKAMKFISSLKFVGDKLYDIKQCKIYPMAKNAQIAF